MIKNEGHSDSQLSPNARHDGALKGIMRNFATPFFLKKIAKLFSVSGYKAAKYVGAKFEFTQWLNQYHLKKNYPLSDGQIGLISCWGIGDTLMVAGLANQLVAAGKVKSVALLVKPGHHFIAGLFPGIDKIYTVPNFADYIEPTSNYPRLTPQIIAPDQYYYAHFFNWEMGGLIGYKQVHLLDAYRAVLKLDQTVPIANPRALNADEMLAAQNILKQYNLNPSKTVIVAPSAVTVTSFPEEFWEALYTKLLAGGYKIVLNATTEGNNQREGILPLNLPFAQLLALAQQCAGVIAVRSGLCDLLSLFKVNLVVLYPNRNWLAGKLFDGSSINAMWSTHNTIELIVENPDAVTAINIADQFLAQVK